MKAKPSQAAKLIEKLEAKLHDALSHTSEAREAVQAWLADGGEKLRKKSASTVSKVKKKAEAFAKVLASLEEKVEEQIEKLTKSKKKPAPARNAPSRPIPAKSKKGRKVALKKPTAVKSAPVAEKDIARELPPSKGLRAQDRRLHAHAAGRGRRAQGKRDAKQTPAAT